MPEYVFSPLMPYTRFLETRSNEQALLYNIDQKMRAAIGNQQELERIGVEIREEITDGVERIVLSNKAVYDAVYDNTEAIHQLRETNLEGFRELRSVLEEGFGEMVGELRDISYLMRELITIAESPTQTWAREQYSIGLAAFKKGFHREALNYVERAIHGYGPHIGFALDHRFQLLRGEILLGNTRNFDPKLIDPVEACAAFEEAVRLAKPDSHRVAAHAAQRAGWAAYIAGDLRKAHWLTRQAIELDPHLASGTLQLARLEVENGHVDVGFQRLQDLLRAKISLVIAATMDTVFQRFPKRLQGIFEVVRTDLECELKSVAKECAPKVRDIQKLAENKENVPEAAMAYEKSAKSIEVLLDLRSQSLLDLVEMLSRSEYLVKEIEDLRITAMNALVKIQARTRQEAAEAKACAERKAAEAQAYVEQQRKKAINDVVQRAGSATTGLIIGALGGATFGIFATLVLGYQLDGPRYSFFVVYKTVVYSCSLGGLTTGAVVGSDFLTTNNKDQFSAKEITLFLAFSAFAFALFRSAQNGNLI